MVMLVTLQQARDQIRSDTNADDAHLTLNIHAASGAVMNYLKSTRPYVVDVDSNGDPVLDSFGDIVYFHDSAGDLLVLPEVQQAVLYLLGVFYRDRDGQEMTDWQQGYLPMPVIALLYPLRDPAFA